MNPTAEQTIRPVDIVSSIPLPVQVVGESGSVVSHNDVQSQKNDPSIPAKTTFQDDLVTLGQRRINLIWEWTQAIISVLVVASNMIVAIYDGLFQNGVAFPVVLSSALFLVVGFYFSRTNHSAIGGIGPKPTESYQGR
jgi:hypothetical protein